MRKDLILTSEEKLSKRQRLEENRRMRFMQFSNIVNEVRSNNTQGSLNIYNKSEPIIVK